MKKKLTRIGWQEWVSFPALKLPPILAKVDTGAKTSALHAFRVDPFVENGVQKISFSIHPFPGRNEAVTCIAEVCDYRAVTDSGGHTEERYVIKTEVELGHHHWPVEITLTNRDNMSFLMLLGRTALRHRFLIHPNKKCLLTSHLNQDSL